MKKVYYQIQFQQISPLRIGNGRSEESDSDLMLDGRGIPFIPGSSIAGIVRHRAKRLGMDEETEKRLFGYVTIADGKGSLPSAKSASILFGDAVIAGDICEDDGGKTKIVFGKRDGVGINEWGCAKGNAKFDFQIVETSHEFRSIIEWSGDETQYEDEIEEIIEPVLKHYVARGIEVGARTTRGYGKFHIKIRRKCFDFPNDLSKWLDFNSYDDKSFSDGKCLEGESGATDAEVRIEFKMQGSFAVRVKTARMELAEDGSLPDSIPMENFRKNPVIPGTTWAGVFRHHMHDLLRCTGIEEEDFRMREIDNLFGFGKEYKDIKKSVITFSESEIVHKRQKEAGESDKIKTGWKMSVTRTAVDRFTSSAKTGSLFTDMVYSGGEGTLVLTFDEKKLNVRQRELIAACICDMHSGLLPVGGEVSVGRGIMSVTRITYNGEEKLKKMLSSVEAGKPLDWLKEEKKNV